MKLLARPASPFARKVRVMARETGLNNETYNLKKEMDNTLALGSHRNPGRPNSLMGLCSFEYPLK